VSVGSGTVLDRILAETREAVRRRRELVPLDPAPLDRDAPRSFRAALAAPGIGVIAEFKRRSPSAGPLHEAPDLTAILGAYERGGAIAASILTEEPNFGGSLQDLRDARATSRLPLLRKDFIVDELQVYESVVAGADAILLIVAGLTDEALRRLQETARTCQLDVLVEVHDLAEMDRALEIGADLIGINNRNLKTFTVDLAVTEELAEEIPSDAVGVSESGIKTAEDVRRVRACGINAVLVGETLMRAKNVREKLEELLLKDGETE